MSDDPLNEDDQFEKNNEIFRGNLDPDIVGLNNLFAETGIHQDDEFFFVSDGDNNNSGEISNKKSKTTNVFKEHLTVQSRKQRLDCPPYTDVIRGFVHSIFRPDTFGKKQRVMAGLIHSVILAVWLQIYTVI